MVQCLGSRSFPWEYNTCSPSSPDPEEADFAAQTLAPGPPGCRSPCRFDAALWARGALDFEGGGQLGDGWAQGRGDTEGRTCSSRAERSTAPQVGEGGTGPSGTKPAVG